MATTEENQIKEATIIFLANSIKQLEYQLSDVQYRKDLHLMYGMSETGTLTRKSKNEFTRLEKKEQDLSEKLGQLSMQLEILKPIEIPTVRLDKYDEWQVIANYEQDEQDRVIKELRETRLKSEEKEKEKDELDR